MCSVERSVVKRRDGGSLGVVVRVLRALGDGGDTIAC